MSFQIYNIDLKKDDQDYACFVGWFISNQKISELQKRNLIEFIQSDHEILNIKSFDEEGEDLDDYCEKFEYFDLNEIDNNSIVCLDLNYLEEYDPDMDLESIFLTDESGKVIVFKTDGGLTKV